MKTFVAGIFIFFFFLQIVTALEVDLLSSAPFPAKPGDAVTLQFALHNTESVLLTKVTLFLEPEDDLFLISDAVQTFPFLQPDERKVVTYRVGISNSASGNQHLKLRFGSAQQPPEEEKFEISVASSKDVLVIRRVVSQPEKIAPGESVQIILEIENMGDEKVEDVSVMLDLSGSIPLAPQASSTERRVEKISKNTIASVSFQVKVLPDADEKVYKIPVRISYQDAFGSSFIKEDLISLEVTTSPLLDVSVDKSGFVIGRKSSVGVTVVNRGLGEIRFLKIRLLPGNYEILSSDQEYVGNLDSDDFQTVDFDVIFHDMLAVMRLEIAYTDASNRVYSEEKRLPITIYSLEKAKELGIVKSRVWIALVGGIVLLLILLFILRLLRKKKV